MTDDKHNGLVIIGIVAIGAIAIYFGYMIYMKSKEEERQKIQYALQTPTVSNTTVYDERVYHILEDQQRLIDGLNTNINELGSKLDSKPKMQITNMSKLALGSRAGSPYTINTVAQDKSRQAYFHML